MPKAIFNRRNSVPSGTLFTNLTSLSTPPNVLTTPSMFTEAYQGPVERIIMITGFTDTPAEQNSPWLEFIVESDGPATQQLDKEVRRLKSKYFTKQLFPLSSGRPDDRTQGKYLLQHTKQRLEQRLTELSLQDKYDIVYLDIGSKEAFEETFASSDHYLWLGWTLDGIRVQTGRCLGFIYNVKGVDNQALTSVEFVYDPTTAPYPQSYLKSIDDSG